MQTPHAQKIVLDIFLKLILMEAGRQFFVFKPKLLLMLLLLCRAALEIIKRHDVIYKQKKAYRDVFLPEAIMLRDRSIILTAYDESFHDTEIKLVKLLYVERTMVCTKVLALRAY
jgi:hypothetical protein